jgi:cytoskeletal protein CcmA (bactofilin family)
MPSSINSTSSSPGGLITTGATDNELEIKTGDTTAISIDASQNVTVAGDLTVSGTVSGTVDVDTVTGTLDVANGGTGATTLTANNVILGNGTSAVSFVAPGSNGNVLTSNGTTWTSAAAAGGGGGTVTSVSGTGTVNGITLSGTVTTSGNLTLSGSVAIAGSQITSGDIAAARITSALNASGSAPIFACRAWANIDGATPAIIGSGNISSISRPSTGTFTINFSTGMSDANYAVSGTGTTTNRIVATGTYAAGSFTAVVRDVSNNLLNNDFRFSVHR